MPLPLKITAPPQNILPTRFNLPPKPLRQPVFLDPVSLSATPLAPTPRPPAISYPEVTPTSPLPAPVTLPQPSMPAFQIFARPLTNLQLPQTAITPQSLGQAAAQWTKVAQSNQPQQLLSPFPSPQVPQTGFVPTTSLPAMNLPKSPALFSPIQPPNSTPTYYSWG